MTTGVSQWLPASDAGLSGTVFDQFAQASRNITPWSQAEADFFMWGDITITGPGVYRLDSLAVVVEGSDLTYDANGVPNGGQMRVFHIVMPGNLAGIGSRPHSPELVSFEGRWLAAATYGQMIATALASGNFAPLKALLDNEHYEYFGSGSDDRFVGGNTDDTIDGRAGADHMTGSRGNDDYIVDNAGDVVVELANEGHDRVRSSASFTLPANVETLELVSYDGLSATGNALANVIWGNEGNDTINGMAGADRMSGGGGNDTYYVDNSGDLIFEDANRGTDWVRSSVSHTLAAELENLVLIGSAAVNATGNALANTISGNAAANVLDGAAGADRMSGGLGNDRFYVDNAGDIVAEAAGQGSDIVYTTVSYTLGAGQEIETFGTTSVAGTTAINLTGNGYGQRINGNNGNNVLYGGAGNDLLVGYGGNDNLEGQAGADTLKGVSGADKFVFRYSTITTAGADHIADFGTDDFVYVDHPSVTGPLNPQSFRVGANALDANDRFIYYAPYDALYFDPDGNGAAAKVLFAVFDNGYVPTAADIVLF